MNFFWGLWADAVAVTVAAMLAIKTIQRFMNASLDVKNSGVDSIRAQVAQRADIRANMGTPSPRNRFEHAGV
jgi:hypothetical protein